MKKGYIIIGNRITTKKAENSRLHGGHGANNGKIGKTEIKTSIYHAVPDGENGCGAFSDYAGDH